MTRRIYLTSFIALLLSSATYAADLPTPQVTPPQTVNSTVFDALGSLSGGYGHSSARMLGDDYDIDAGFVSGRASISNALFGDVGYQLDGMTGYNGLSFDDGSSIDMYNATGSGHVFFRQNDSWAAGLLTQYAFVRYSVDDSSGKHNVNTNNAYIGPEAQYYLGDFTIYGQAGYAAQWINGRGPSYTGNGFYTNAEVKYFINDNLDIALGAHYKHMDVDQDSDEYDVDALSASIKSEYKLDLLPIVLSAELSYGRWFDDDTDKSLGTTDRNHDSEFRAVVGLTYNFSDLSLKDRNHHGASFDPVDPFANGLMSSIW